MHDIDGRPTVAEVSLSALRSNCREVCALVGGAVTVMAVVKADAYGHGAPAAARAFRDGGAKTLGVSTVAEGVELRRAGIDGPIVVLGGVFRGEGKVVVEHDLGAALWTPGCARALGAAATAAGRTVDVHLKVDTGMTRLGVDLADMRTLGEAVRDVDGVRIAGVFSHFASADAVDTLAARAQIERFREAVAALAAAGIRPPHVHLANSAAVLSAPDAHFSMVRPGIMLYGYAPAPHLASRAQLRPAMRLRTAVAQARPVEAGRPVGYGGTFVTARPSTIATVPMGYADGYHRLASNRASVLVGGKRAPIAGRVCMDNTMLDVTDVGLVEVGTPVVAFGRQDGAFLGADELAAWCDTISYEVLTSVGRRVPRVYVEEFDG